MEPIKLPECICHYCKRDLSWSAPAGSPSSPSNVWRPAIAICYDCAVYLYEQDEDWMDDNGEIIGGVYPDDEEEYETWLRESFDMQDEDDWISEE